MFILKLAISNLRVHRVRVALTIAAVALSVSLVVGVTSGYASLQAAAARFLHTYLGSSDAQISRAGDPTNGVSESLEQLLRRDPAVHSAVGRLEISSGMLNAAGRPVGLHPAQVIGIQRPDDQQVESLRMREGVWFDSSDGDAAVVDQAAADMLDVGIGGRFALAAVNARLELRVVGIVHKPEILARHIQTIYVPLRTLQRFVQPDRPATLSRVLVDLKPDADPQAFADRWQETLRRTDPALRLRMGRDNRAELEKNLQGVAMMSYFGGAVSMIAAAFIVFSTLSMGVSERGRTLAMLRAVGALRLQLGLLVVAEGLLLALAGVIIGVPLGCLWMYMLAWMYPKLFSSSVVISAGGVWFGAAGSLLTALLASFLPAWAAMRVRPLAALTLLARPPRRFPWPAALAGAFLLGLDPFVLGGPLQNLLADTRWEWLIRPIQFYSHFALGLPGLMIGFFLLAPLFVRLVDALFSTPTAMVLGVRPALLRQQLSGGLWRSAGTAAALMVGLAVLVVMQTQGHSALAAWRLPDRFPDVFIFSPMRLDENAQRKIVSMPEIAPEQTLPIAIASPDLGTSIFAIAGASVLPDATMFFGVDPDRAMEMMELDFREGNAADAARMLRQGRHLIITEEFRQLKNLHVGDKFPLRTAAGRTLEYTVAGSVWSPGIDVIVAMFDMGKQFEQRTISSVFGSIEDARRDFGVEGVYLVAANLRSSIEKEQLTERLSQKLGVMGLRVGDIRAIKAAIQRAFRHLLTLASTVAVAAMAVASLGVANTIMASVRSRRWQFGILRSVGVTRGGLLRLVLGEAFLLGAVGAAMGLAAGLLMSVNARFLSRQMLGFIAPMHVPWGIVLLGVVAVMVISLLASLWPAVGVARARPLRLLQAGRAAG